MFKLTVSIKNLLSSRAANPATWASNEGSKGTLTFNKFVKLIELNLNKKAKVSYLSLQPGDVVKTHASVRAINKSIKTR